MSKERQGWRERHSRSKPNQLEQSPHGGGIKSSERPLPNVWDILERQVKLWAPEFGKPIMSKKKYIREAEDVRLLKDEVEEKGTQREKHIFALFDLEQMFIRPDRPGLDLLPLLRTDLRSIYLKELHQLRSQVEAMSDEELAEEVRQLKQLEAGLKRGNK
jgi:hypothetical protein